MLGSDLKNFFHHASKATQWIWRSVLCGSSFLVTQFFPVLNEILHYSKYSMVHFHLDLYCYQSLLLFFLMRYVPETHAVALDDIELLLAERIKHIKIPCSPTGFLHFK
ncbi:hypothetical protein U4Q53_26085 [Klebsiella pneumoniae]